MTQATIQSAAETILEVSNLRKSYAKKQALQDVTFSLKAGTSFGFLGPNGAGKSTTMKILTGIVKADGGSARLFGREMTENPDAVSRYIGYVPQEITLYEKLSAYDNLEFFGQTYGIRGNELKRRIYDVLERTGLSERAKQEVQTFSGGMKRRINIAAALLHRPKLLILDEPTVGIDPQSRNHIFDLIRELNREGVTIIYSTHYMEEVEALCDEVAIMDQGSVKAIGPLGELLERYGRKAIYLEAAGLSEPPHDPDVFHAHKEGSGWVLETERVGTVMQRLLGQASQQRWDVKQLEVVRPSLESVFLRVTGTALRD
ncbi:MULTISPECIES: ABC transporter ATP-binding protein [unclassified Paenibacillus]|uniref:ABC transporter ATP-binding protein n=1 Tax=unclassified Paenibacillus TaxID=185978 RepID=UPI001C0FEE09|nr:MULTISPECIES: ABC transporter ATP-binding protein [unclassified Paenibacillus]MBU5441185.1 ABC transporter ATP-binding protein [Paenibacillus sp. MSJ-34]CAH0120490.1 Linearmycin resistance ATP-binding protein LnrL [Paenibacillus sp. CECT 9249]